MKYLKRKKQTIGEKIKSFFGDIQDLLFFALFVIFGLLFFVFAFGDKASASSLEGYLIDDGEGVCYGGEAWGYPYQSDPYVFLRTSGPFMFGSGVVNAGGSSTRAYTGSPDLIIRIYDSDLSQIGLDFVRSVSSLYDYGSYWNVNFEPSGVKDLLLDGEYYYRCIFLSGLGSFSWGSAWDPYSGSVDVFGSSVLFSSLFLPAPYVDFTSINNPAYTSYILSGDGAINSEIQETVISNAYIFDDLGTAVFDPLTGHDYFPVFFNDDGTYEIEDTENLPLGDYSIFFTSYLSSDPSTTQDSDVFTFSVLQAPLVVSLAVVDSYTQGDLLVGRGFLQGHDPLAIAYIYDSYGVLVMNGENEYFQVEDNFPYFYVLNSENIPASDTPYSVYFQATDYSLGLEISETKYFYVYEKYSDQVEDLQINDIEGFFDCNSLASSVVNDNSWNGDILLDPIGAIAASWDYIQYSSIYGFCFLADGVLSSAENVIKTALDTFIDVLGFDDVFFSIIGAQGEQRCLFYQADDENPFYDTCFSYDWFDPSDRTEEESRFLDMIFSLIFFFYFISLFSKLIFNNKNDD